MVAPQARKESSGIDRSGPRARRRNRDEAHLRRPLDPPARAGLAMSAQRHGVRPEHPIPLPAGALAPNFTLKSTPDQTVSLSESRGRPVLPVFSPADWSPVCTDQLSPYNEIRPEFQKHNSEIVAIPVDGVWSHAAFARDRNLHFPLLADFEPKGDVSRRHGVYLDLEGESARALDVIDPKGRVRWSYVSPTGVNPGADGILSALEGLSREGSRS
jgi:peroxiredoxin